jgi:hypothetical protein
LDAVSSDEWLPPRAVPGGIALAPINENQLATSVVIKQQGDCHEMRAFRLHLQHQREQPLL